MNGFIAL
jgi:hypothetical protein